MMHRTLLLLALTAALGACQHQPETPKSEEAAPAASATSAASSAELFTAALDSALAGAHRSAANKARDAYRHPKETLGFFDLGPGQTVIEITPGGGWYLEILAPLMRGQGRYIAASWDTSVEGTPKYYIKYDGELRAKIASDPNLYDQAEIVAFKVAAPNFGAPNSADRVLTFRNVHNWILDGAAPAMFQAFFAVLKPGGILGVVEHRAATGADPADSAKTGYMSEDAVIAMAEAAGFKLVAKSDINANPKDTKNHEKGVWTLPPTLALGEKDKDKYLAIGESDRMTLKFVKPAGDTIHKVAD